MNRAAIVLGLLAMAAIDSLSWPGSANWPIVLLITAPMVVIFLPRDIAAGSDWLRRGRKWVDVYALKKIDATRYTDTDLKLTLIDTNERWMKITSDEIESVPIAWALTFNGIRHSVDAGATVCGDIAEEWLGLTPNSASSYSNDRATRHGKSEWIIAWILVFFSIASTFACCYLFSKAPWFRDLKFGSIIGAGAIVLSQLLTYGAAVGTRVPRGMKYALACILWLTVGLCVIFAPIGALSVLSVDRGTSAIGGLAIGIALLAAAWNVMRYRARIVYLVARLLRPARRE